MPLSPNWRLAPDGTGVRLKPILGKGPGSKGRRCGFEIVKTAQATVCGNGRRWRCNLSISRLRSRYSAVINLRRCYEEGPPDAEQALSDEMTRKRTGTGRPNGRPALRRRLQEAHRGQDQNPARFAANGSAAIGVLVPKTTTLTKSRRASPRRWRNGNRSISSRARKFQTVKRPTSRFATGCVHGETLFSPRQLLCHGTSVEVFRGIARSREDAAAR